MLLDQDPPDTDNVFRVPYLNRWNLVGSAYKGFVRAYRQTAEGIRSAAGTANFISTDSAAYAASADDYDGSTNFALRGSDYTSNADSKVCTFSVWFRVDGGGASNRVFISNQFGRIQLTLNTSNQFRMQFRDSAATIILHATSTTTFAAGAAWHNVIFSCNLGTTAIRLVVDGVEETPTIITGPTNANIDWTTGEQSFGSNTGGTSDFDGCISDLYFNNAEYLDISDPNNIGAFISPAGEPVDLGANASFPTGAIPILAVLGGDPSTNIGYGGNLVNQAALSACSSSP